MHINRRIRLQLATFIGVSIVAITVMSFAYLRVPSLLFGIGQYTVTVQLSEAAGLYKRANVTYRGTEVGQVDDVRWADSGVEAVLSLKSSIKIPSNLRAEVHSQSAIGEQYVALLPRDSNSPPLRQGSVIARADTTVPPDINTLLDATNRGLQAVPRDNLKTTVDESYTAFGGLGPDIARLVKGSTALAIDARANLDELTNVIDNTPTILDTQTDTASSVHAWAAHLADVATALKSHDSALSGVLQNGPEAAAEVRRLFDRVKPTLPVLLANLVSVGEVGVTYRDNLEQVLVLVPQGVAQSQGTMMANRGTKQDYSGALLSFNLNFNVPPPCLTGFLPPTQMRAPSLEDAPDRPKGLLYCRVPQDSTLNVRGARNYPCETRPGKRAASVELCESDEPYVPLNDGFNWKGDANATLSGQGVPQFPTGTAPPPGYSLQPPAPPPVAVAEYDPNTGTYIGPDGKLYSRTDLIPGATENRTWESMLLPPAG